MPTLRVVRLAGASPEQDFASLVKRALDGDSAAWSTLVERLQGVVWHALATFSMSTEDRKDAFAATFGRLFERLATVREPEKLPGWMVTTARHEAQTVLRSRNRLVPSSQVTELGTSFDPLPDEQLLDDELRVALRAAFGRLSPDCQRVLRAVCQVPPLSYDDVAVLLDKKRGSIGPERKRCLDKLRAMPELRPFLGGA